MAEQKTLNINALQTAKSCLQSEPVKSCSDALLSSWTHPTQPGEHSVPQQQEQSWQAPRTWWHMGSIYVVIINH